jgi:3-deoxy-7-phosphoheptulonate synthase
MVEVHPNPREALCDGPQSLDLDGIRALMTELERVAASVDKTLA